jgi:hypothetical protein
MLLDIHHSPIISKNIRREIVSQDKPLGIFPPHAMYTGRADYALFVSPDWLVNASEIICWLSA